ncbi:SlyX family protein, partial [Pulveribacter sp.]
MPDPSHTPDDIAQRLEALEIKASFTEDLLDQLNLTIYRQQQHIDELLRAVA